MEKVNTLESATELVPDQLRQAYVKNSIVPLWESVPAKNFGVQTEEAQLWAWETMRPIVIDTGKLKAEHVLERRVLSLVNPGRTEISNEASTGSMNATLQMVLPGERAKVHRHSMNALRFVLETSGGTRSIVNGKDCPMALGDLVLTPGWCWHEHVNEGTEPIIWMDVLDVALQYALGATAFQPGPRRDTPAQLDEEAFASPNITPIPDTNEFVDRGYSPVFRYPWEDALKAVKTVPYSRDGARHVRYANPLTGGPGMLSLDSTLIELAPGKATIPYRNSASTICCVVEGEGSSQIGEKTIHWSPKDIFTVPSHLWASHQAEHGIARIFQISNREVYRRLGLFSEAYKE